MDPNQIRMLQMMQQRQGGSMSGAARAQAEEDPRLIALEAMSNPKPFIPGVPDPNSRESESYLEELYEADDSDLSPYEAAQMQASLGGGPGPQVMTPELERKRHMPHQRMVR